MPQNVTQKLIASHLVEGDPVPGREIGLRIDQTLTQDATGTLVMLELEAMGLDRVKTEVSAQYVDHNLIQEDAKNPDDHLFLRSACRRFGVWYSRPGNGVSHPVHQERFGKPGKTLLGSDSHTPAGGAIGMLAIGAGGLEVALAMAGEPFYVRCPEVWGVELAGELPPWVSAKDVILEMLRRHDVDGGIGRVVEYFGPGLATLSAMDRHVIANMGTELGATSTVFPSDGEVRHFLASQGREEDWTELVADPGARYDVEETIDLSTLEPLIAMPSSPGKVRRVAEVAGEEIYQSYVGSSANPGYRDFAVAAEMVAGRQVHDRVSFDVNPSSRQILANLAASGALGKLIAAGARIHQAGCNGCIGMGQAPATHAISLRTVPRNFPGRSGTREDKVCLVSPETAAASALTGEITDPRTLGERFGMTPPVVEEPSEPILVTETLVPPLPPEEAREVELVKGPNIATLPSFEPLPDRLELPVLLKVGDDVSTDEIMPAGARVLPFRSNVPRISEFCFDVIDESYPRRAAATRETGDGHAVVGGSNYGQGSSREHAAIAPRYLGLRAVLVRGFARIHHQNLVNFGVLPLTFEDPASYPGIEQGNVLVLEGLHAALGEGGASDRQEDAKADGGGGTLVARNVTRGGREIPLRHHLSPRQVAVLRQGGLINWMKRRLGF
ncbi:MAG TPA: aconitate hydratase [Thermoanaerobaculia bacterium]|nr:aconitate hydratase [Thermoanaerobaculia bacterium]